MTRAVSSKNTRCRFGIAVRDVTGHAGMYMRWWGAANHDVADGVHRPSTATAAVIAPLDGDGPELALVALDYCCFMGPDDERVLRQTVRERTGLAEEAFILNCAHQHSTVNAGSQIADKPGGEFGAAYRARLADAITDAIREAREQRAPAWITYGQGRCNLAVNRDYWDAEASRWACGYNPDAAGGRYRARRARDRRRRHGAGDLAQLCLPSDDAGVGQSPALARLRRRGAGGAGARVRRARALHAGSLRRSRAARRLSSGTRRSPTATGGNSATPPPAPSRRSRPPG